MCTYLEFTIRFVEEDYSAQESEMLHISIMATECFSNIVNPIGIRVTTLTVDDSVLLGNPLIIPPPSSSFSPNLAGKKDIILSCIQHTM